MHENRFLKAEHQLVKAQYPKIYLLFDLVQKTIQVKFKGTLLKELSIDAYTLWGTPIQPIFYSLVKKKAFLESKRPKITPRMNNEEFPSELYAFGVDEMPTRYCLLFREGFYIYVRPKSEGILSTFLNACASIKSFLLRPLMTLWSSLNQRPYTAIDIYLSEKESKSLYWVLREDFRCIIYHWT